ncbi:agmatine deiminase family protein [Acidisarcina polymorpha]|nr:agmatine deiminase family protein [Acidisarcina polymorpha]
MPAEWERHEATWIAWPHNATDWPGKFLAIPWVYADIVRKLSQVETVHVLVDDKAAEQRATSILLRAGANLGAVCFHQVKTDRVWTRDSGPIFVKNFKAIQQNTVAVTNWKFNAWAKYENWHHDDQVPDHAAAFLKMQQWKPNIRLQNGQEHRLVLEGGSIDVNGSGVLITTEECLLSTVQQRNPGVSREQLEQVFHDYLGIEKVLWMNRGCAGDDTHGHVDDITRFVSENTIVTATEANTSDENHDPLAENLDRLKSAKNLHGKPFQIVELPMPSPVVFDGQRLPASYANFYIANHVVLVPSFNDPNDRKALAILAELFPDRTVSGIHCGDLIWGLGALHCMTQQQPA